PKATKRKRQQHAKNVVAAKPPPTPGRVHPKNPPRPAHHPPTPPPPPPPPKKPAQDVPAPTAPSQPPAAVNSQDAPHAAPRAQTTGQTQTISEATGGDAAAGRQVFRKCQACHSMEPGKNMLGPSLAGLLGRKAGSESGYNYSSAMKQENITWDAKTLDAYLADPQKSVPGNKMPFPGLKTDHDRADIIAFVAASTGAQAAAPAPQTGAAQTAQSPPPPTTQEPPRTPG